MWQEGDEGEVSGGLEGGSGALGAHLEELRRRNLRPSSVAQRRYALRRLARYIGRDPLYATPDELVAFTDRLTEPESRATEMSHLRQFYRWAIETERIDRDPTYRLRRPRLPRRLPKPISEGDLAMALDLAPERIRPWLLLAGWAGLRCAEIAPLRAHDVWWQSDPPLIIIAESKGGDEESMPMSRFLAAELAGCDLPSRGWLFPRYDGQAGHTPAYLVSRYTNDFLKSIGIDSTMHKLRHRFGTQMLRAADGNVRIAQEALRHRAIASTQRYTFVEPTDVRAAIERIPSARSA